MCCSTNDDDEPDGGGDDDDVDGKLCAVVVLVAAVVVLRLVLVECHLQCCVLCGHFSQTEITIMEILKKKDQDSKRELGILIV